MEWSGGASWRAGASSTCATGLRGTTEERTAEVLRVARGLLEGVPARSVERMNPEVMAAILPRIYSQMLEEIYAHQDAGRATFIVSAAGNGVVEPLAHVLGMDGGIGTTYEIGKDGAFTGQLDGPFVYGPGKVEAMRASPPSTRSTSTPPTPTRTRSRPADAARGRQPGRGQPRSDPGRDRARGGWQTMRFEQLGRRLVALAITALATVGGFGARRVAARRRPPPRRFAVRR
jgi:hypothetical protein